MNELINAKEKLMTTKEIAKELHVSEWYTIEELAELIGSSVQTLQKGDSPLQKLKDFGIDFKVESKIVNIGGHKNVKFYSSNVLKALKQYQLKNSAPNALKNKETAITGNVSFTVNQTIDNLMNNPETMELLYLKSLERCKSLGIENRQLKDVIQEQKPKVEFYDDVTGSDDTIGMAEVAKILNLGIGRNKIFELLRKNYILQQNNTPYQKYVDLGYFRIIESKYTLPDGTTKISLKTVVFQKGLDFLRKTLKKYVA